MNTNNKRPKVFVMGLDGATFDLIRPWVKEGRLPNLAKMMGEGVHGELRSTIPPQSPSAWASFATGVNPGKHGIFDFVMRRPHSYEMQLVNAALRRAKPIWSILSENGKKVGIINLPITYPPDKVNGFMISGIDTPEEENIFTYPANLYEKVKKSVGKYIIDVDIKRHHNFEGFREDKCKMSLFVDTLFKMIENRAKIATYLKETFDWDLFLLVFVAPDRVQHGFWDYMDRTHLDYSPEKAQSEYGDVIFKVYKRLDEVLGDLTKDLDDNTTVIILSDHGMAPLNKKVSLNRWLEEHGYLDTADFCRKKSARSLSYCLKREVIKKFGMTLLTLKSKLWRLAPQKIRTLFKRQIRWARENAVYKLVTAFTDWKHTKAFSLGVSGSIYINVRGREPNGIVGEGQEYENLRNQLIDELEELVDPENGKKVIDKVYKREELYYGKYLHAAPDLLLTCKRGYQGHGMATLSPDGIKNDRKELFRSDGTQAATHELDGIFIIKGPHIKKRLAIQGTEIVDLAPTILYLLNVPIPASMDGKVLVQAFEHNFVSGNQIQYSDSSLTKFTPDGKEHVYSEEDARRIKKRLQDLGYLE